MISVTAIRLADVCDIYRFVAMATSAALKLEETTMSGLLRRCFAAVVCLALGFSGLQRAAAQHHGGHHGYSHHGGYYGGWGHVVPSQHHYAGLYYSYGGANYYTPVASPMRVQVMRPQINHQPTTIAPPSDPIAPQSVKLEFGGFQQFEDLSARLAVEANRWCLDLHYNYGHNIDFDATYRDAYLVVQAAKYVRTADHRGDRETISKQMAAVEPLFHQVQEKIKTWTRDERRPVGSDDVNGKTALVESILHHLLYDVGVAQQHTAALEEEAPPPAELLAPPAGKRL
ncbi:MAG: hypothetical protein C0483_10390 [Pirellula sp.]|nr:hypothetical protein [Pirellula sp.]